MILVIVNEISFQPLQVSCTNTHFSYCCFVQSVTYLNNYYLNFFFVCYNMSICKFWKSNWSWFTLKIYVLKRSVKDISFCSRILPIRNPLQAGTFLCYGQRASYNLNVIVPRLLSLPAPRKEERGSRNKFVLVLSLCLYWQGLTAVSRVFCRSSLRELEGRLPTCHTCNSVVSSTTSIICFRWTDFGTFPSNYS